MRWIKWYIKKQVDHEAFNATHDAMIEIAKQLYELNKRIDELPGNPNRILTIEERELITYIHLQNLNPQYNSALSLDGEAKTKFKLDRIYRERTIHTLTKALNDKLKKEDTKC
jgi:hypothetical protein